jgi:chorismate synthase
VLLRRYGVEVSSHVIGIGSAALPAPLDVTFDDLRRMAWDDDVRCVDAGVADAMRRAVDAAKEAGDTLGGAFEVIAHRVPPGLGSYVQWDRKLDGRIGQALLSIPAIKAVGFGRAAAVGSDPGSRVHDEILLDDTGEGMIPGLRRPTNRAGGLEGGVTNGEDVRATAWMKPISTLMKPLRSVDLETKTEAEAAIERSDVCAVPAAAVVGEAMMCFVLAQAWLERFGGDTIAAVDAAWQRDQRALQARTGAPVSTREHG